MYDTLSEGKRNKNNDHNREYTNIYIYIYFQGNRLRVQLVLLNTVPCNRVVRYQILISS